MVFLPDNSPDNIILGDSDANLLVGTGSQDAIFGLGGSDQIVGGGEIDALYGNADTDSLYGSQADDFLFGGQDNDLLFGGQGNDQLSGDQGNDTLHGDKGADTLTGGAGADGFVVGAGTGGFSVSEADLITDFAVGEDLIQLTAGLTFADLEILGTAGDTILQDATTGEILAVLQGVDRATVTSASFQVDSPELPEPELPPISNIDFEPPTLQAGLENDTGISEVDNVTSDPTILGGFSDNVGVDRLEASLDGETFVTVLPTFNSAGNFVLAQGDLEFIRGSRLSDGSYTLQLRAVDTAERVSAIEQLTLP